MKVKLHFTGINFSTTESKNSYQPVSFDRRSQKHFCGFKMSYFNQFLVYPWFFFLFAATTFVPAGNTKNWLIKFTQYIPRSVSLLLMTSLAREVVKLSFNSSHLAHLYIAAGSQGFPGLFTVFVCTFQQNKIEAIYRTSNITFAKIENSFQISIKKGLFKETLRHRFHYGIALIFAVHLWQIIFSIIFSNYINPTTKDVNILYGVQGFYNLVAVFHVFSFVYFIEFSLKTVNDKLNSAESDLTLYLSRPNTLQLMSLLRCIKVVYFRIHRVSIMISQTFGWFAISVFLSSACTVVSSMFFLYMQISSTTNLSVLVLMRKY